jgi:hypothetical protein
MKHILIGTTATNRSLLHKETIPEWYNYINQVDKTKYSLKWFINIDYIDKLDENVKKTWENFQKIIIDIPIIWVNKKSNEKGNFLKACQTVAKNIEDYKNNNKWKDEDVIIFWLEDDWKQNKYTIPVQELIEYYLSDLTHINLSYIRANYIHALAPGIHSYNLWKQLHLAAWKHQELHIDPEHCAGKYFIKKFGKLDNINNITVFSKYKQNAISILTKEPNSSTYICFDEDVKKVELSNLIKKKNVKEICNNKITFIRIRPTFCEGGVNFGRDFMKKYEIEKSRLQNKNNIDFYK